MMRCEPGWVGGNNSTGDGFEARPEMIAGFQGDVLFLHDINTNSNKRFGIECLAAVTAVSYTHLTLPTKA